MHYSLDTSIYTIRLSYTGNTSHKCCKWNMKWWTQDEHYTPRFSRSAWSSSMATQEKLMQVSKLICLFILEKMVLIVQNINFIMVWLSRADFINSFKNHTDIGRKNCGAFADATLVEVVEVFINSHIVNNTLICNSWNTAEITLVFIEITERSFLYNCWSGAIWLVKESPGNALFIRHQ